MSFTSPIPSGAADRIIRNPHCLPRIPAQLANVIANNRHRERLRFHSERAYLLRRSKLENERVKRMSTIRDNEDDSNAIAVTPSPPSSPVMEGVDTSPLKRSQSLSGLDSSSSHARPYLRHHQFRQRSPSSSSSSTNTTGSSFTGNGMAHLQRRRSLFDINDIYSTQPSRNVYYTDADSEDTATTFRRLSQQLSPPRSSPQIARRHSIDIHHLHTPTVFIRNPEERAKMRWRYSKRPTPSWRSVHAASAATNDYIIATNSSSAAANGNANTNSSDSSSSNTTLHSRRLSAGSHHPSWHRIMRDEYKTNGMEDLWKEERNRFLQEYRRDRQFMKQTLRRRISQ